MHDSLRMPCLRERGAALVIVLAFVVLLCGMVVAFFSRAASNRELSNSSFQQAKVGELGRSVLNLITGNLKQEIADGSTCSLRGGVTIYFPRDNAAAQPVCNGVDAAYPSPTLLRISTTETIPAPGADYAASDASSTGTSANGRAVTLARWNQHYLVPRDPAKYGGTNSTKLGTDPVPAFAAPKWVYMTGTGPAVPALTSPTASVIGRYAYAMYDEGALLDANVAGGPYASSNTSGTVAREYAAKGSVAFADLTALGISGASGVTVGINNLAGWRHYASLQPNGTLQSNFTFPSAIPAQYRDLVLSNTSGFLRVGDATRNGQTDQAFLSRQALIAFSRATSGGMIRQDALQYLGTFSRALTAPSWSPWANASAMGGDDTGAGTFAYKSNADSVNITDTDGAFLFNPNRALPNVRFPGNATVTHYDDDGNAARSWVRAGEPLLQRRFSLAKLAWLTPRGPSASLPLTDPQYQKGGTPEAIRACFGLAWVPSADPNTAPYWDYQELAASPVGIKALAEVAAENREPNFFEMLKAGILAGSLGKHPGAIGGGAGLSVPPADTAFEGPAGASFERFSGEKNRHILQIGANIIDQADADSFPTAIHFPAFAEDAHTPGDKINNMVFGNENLPCLTQLVPLGMEFPQGTLHAVLQPSVWNPHQAAATAPAVAPPSQFRTRAYGAGRADWYLPDAGLANNHLTEGSSTDFSASALPGPGTVYFSDPNTGGTASAFYAHPAALSSTNIDTALTPAPNYYPGTSPAYPLDGGTANQYAGILVGRNTHFDAAALLAEAGPGAHLRIVHNLAALTVCLECYEPSTATWRPYSFLSRLSAPAFCGGPAITLQFPPALNGSTLPGDMSYLRADPRTDRFSAASCRTAAGYAPPASTLEASSSSLGRYESYFPWRACGFTYRPDPGSVLSVSGQAAWPQAWAINQPVVSGTQWPGAATNAYYADPDGVIRPGDGFRRNASTGDGCMLYHASQSPASAAARRPVILNRAFRSVGELGYVFRDLPFKTLDFSSPLSADAGLLDLFVLRDQPPVSAGQVNLSNAPAPVLQAILMGAAKTSGTSSTTGPAITKTDAVSLASALAAAFNGSGADGPLLNRADLVVRLSGIVNQSFASAPDKATKAIGEAPVRALAEVANTRTWNLFIDVIAQTGVFPPAAKDLQQFVVQGEQRYWLHLAIDRYTGAVVDQQLEPVFE
ncbi:MAG: hypothetical protein PHQ12_04100 [Chthoniobacteraceae bacterium]|nr:hypothetical protein [Chthoniobacteraceae bacterium]